MLHPNQPELQVHLAIPGPPFSPEMVESINRALDEGGMNGLGLAVDDCRKTAEDAQVEGRASSSRSPRSAPTASRPLLRDNSGNWMVLVEHKAYTHADFEE